MASSPVNEKTDLVSFSILVNGSEIDATYQVTHIEVIKELNRIPRAQFSILDGDPAQETFVISNSSDFVPGNPVEIQAGYHGINATIFKGIITGQGIRARSGTGPHLVVECRDKSVKATLGRKNAYFSKSKDSDVINKLLSDNGLSATVDSTSTQWDELIQYYATDWDFVLTRAEVNGFVVNADDGSITVQKPNFSGSAVITVTYGQDMLEFEGDVDAQRQLSDVTANSWDMDSQAVINSQSSEPSVNSQGNISGSKLADVLGVSGSLQSSGALPQGSLKTWADASLLKTRMSGLQGTVEFQGNADVKPDTVIEVKELGDRFNGNAYVSSITHTIEEGNWRTEARFGASDTWFTEAVQVEAPPTSGLLPGVDGLQTAVVKQIDSDPNNDFRVLVTLPLIQSGDDGVWARLANFYATSGAGSFFYPEVGDEVVLGFLNNDPRYPVILGSLYSSSNAPKDTPDSDNSIKEIVTKNQLILQFDDKNKVIEISTPGGNKITLTDQDEGITIQDQNSNKAEFSSSGITIQSASSMTLKAAESMTIQAADITVKGDQSVSISGMSVTAKADTSLTAQGQASAEFSSSGQCTVKGAMVMIN